MKRNITDQLEKQLADALAEANIDFVHESEKGNQNKGIDFFLPAPKIYIEVKQYHSDRISNQMSKHEETIAIQGKAALNYFIDIIRKSNHK